MALGRRVAVPEYIDIYGLTKHRDAETIKRFLDEYVDESAHEDMGDGGADGAAAGPEEMGHKVPFGGSS